ncbi:MAG: chemotaxis protein [Proteobacteria bacterium]|nr:chemotaxis protein [Pseudomonadota bacterium]
MALVISLWGLMRTQSDFSRYIGTEQAAAAGLSELYAQGLQSGQALRNIVLDPANTKAYDNLKASHQAFDKAYEATLALARGTPMEAALLPIKQLRAAQVAIQGQVRDQARSDPAAAAQALNSLETPAWRALRSALLQQIEGARATADEVHRSTQAQAERMQRIAAAVALFAALAAAALTVVMVRTLRLELGGEPAEARRALGRVAEGDLSAAAEHDAPHGLMAELVRMRASLRGLVTQVHGAAVEITHASSEIAQGNADLSGRTESQASALEETAASMEQLGATVRQNADNARAANQLALTASTVAARGGEVVSQVVDTMKGINDSSSKIADIIGVIDGIAFQTNILALNAAVEAARAGEQGRGFAVVAGEVRSLAQRSAEAAKQIKELITASVERVRQGTGQVDQAGATMSEVVTAIRRVTDIMGEISAASGEQSAGVAQVGEAITQMDQATQQNAALVEESAAAAEALKRQAQELLAAISQFRLAENPRPGALPAATTPRLLAA